jgi:hypothetical protein
MDPIIDLTFDHNYDVTILPETPWEVIGHGLIYFPGIADGLTVTVEPNVGHPWTGLFVFGGMSPDRGVSGVYACPGGDRLFVIAKGGGYLVCADNPSEWEEVRMDPILAVRPIVEEQLIVFADDVNLLAYGSSGVVWKTDRLVMDWLVILNVQPGLIRCSGWDPAAEKDVEVDVDPKTGRVLSERHVPT